MSEDTEGRGRDGRRETRQRHGKREGKEGKNELEPLVDSPRRPNPAAIPPKTLRTIHSLSRWSSSRISNAARMIGFENMLVALYCAGRGRVLDLAEGESEESGFRDSVPSGRQMDNKNNRNSFVRDE